MAQVSVDEDGEGDDDGLTDAQKRELERRLAAYEADPDDVISWETVKRMLEKRLAAYEASGYKGDGWENVVERIRAKK